MSQARRAAVSQPMSQGSLKKLQRKIWKQILMVRSLTGQKTKRKMRQMEVIKHRLKKIKQL